MIVDCFTHTWDTLDQLGRCLPASPTVTSHDPAKSAIPSASPTRHLASADPVDVSFVLGFRSRYLDAHISNDVVASYVAKHPDKLIGFAGIDPSDPKQAIDELLAAKQQLGMPGCAVAPAAQDFHPTNSQAMLVYSEVAKLKMPIVFHLGIHIATASKLEYSRPILLDEVARDLPELRIVIGSVGFPWTQDTILLLGKHKHVFAEISGLMRQPWQAYQTLLSAYQAGVMHKLLLGSGFPHSTATQCIEDLYSINHFAHGMNLPTVPRDQLRGIVERDTLALLGLSTLQIGQASRPSTTTDDFEQSA